jgi:hypothetical protein
VRVDAWGAHVALAWPVRVPEVREAVPRVLGRSITGRAARTGIAVRNSGPKRPGNGTGIEGPMFVTTALGVLVLLTVILSMVPCPGLAIRPH